MNELDPMRKQARDMASDPNAGLDELVKASELLKNAEDIENTRTQTAKLNAEAKRSPLIQFLNLLAPTLTVAILAATLFFQFRQQRQTEQDRMDDRTRAETQRRDDRDDARWSEAVKSVSETHEKDPTAAVVLLRGIQQTSKLHADDAVQLTISILRDVRTFDDFQRLFAVAFSPATQDNLDNILDLDRAIHQQWINRHLDPKFSGLEPEHLVIREMSFLCTQIHPLLQKRPAGTFFDLNHVALFDCVIPDVDLTGANLEGFTGARVSMPGANLSGVTKFEDGYWNDTVWWNAKTINPDLLAYLKRTAKFSAEPKGHYGPNLHPTEKEYEDGVNNLEKTPGSGK